MNCLRPQTVCRIGAAMITAASKITNRIKSLKLKLIKLTPCNNRVTAITGADISSRGPAHMQATYVKFRQDRYGRNVKKQTAAS